MPKHAILIVDDEEAVLESLRHLFRRAYRVVTAESGEAALEIVRTEEIHVILSDQRMPGLTGDRFLAQARVLRPQAVRLLFTGYADLQAVIRAINEGQIHRYVVKPWDPSELESIVRQAVAQYDLVADRTRLMEDLRQANERLQEANARLTEREALQSAFLEVASHEFNTPVQLISGLTELLGLSSQGRDPEEAEILDHLRRSAGQLAKLVRSTLETMSAEDYRNSLHLEEVPLGPLIGGAAEQVRPFLRARSQPLALSLADDLGSFRVDAEKFRDAVVQLLTNAIKFTPDGGRIALSASLVGPDLAEIVVADEGLGMAPEEVAHIFEPFFTSLDPSRHCSGEFEFGRRGLGLGLSLVKRVIDLHHGSVEVRSTPGEGSTFRVRLPRSGDPGSYAPSPDTWQL